MKNRPSATQHHAEMAMVLAALPGTRAELRDRTGLGIKVVEYRLVSLVASGVASCRLGARRRVPGGQLRFHHEPAVYEATGRPLAPLREVATLRRRVDGDTEAQLDRLCVDAVREILGMAPLYRGFDKGEGHGDDADDSDRYIVGPLTDGTRRVKQHPRPL